MPTTTYWTRTGPATAHSKPVRTSAASLRCASTSFASSTLRLSTASSRAHDGPRRRNGHEAWGSPMTLENDLWLLEQQSRALQECRRDLAWVWNDEAARELNRRYLDPHAADDGQLHRALHQELE